MSIIIWPVETKEKKNTNGNWKEGRQFWGVRGEIVSREGLEEEKVLPLFVGRGESSPNVGQSDIRTRL